MNIFAKRELQKENLLFLAEQGEPKFTNTFFPYTSGQIGNYYIQSLSIMNDGFAYAKVIDSLVGLIKANVGIKEFDAISGGESRDWDFSNPVAVTMKKPHLKLYKERDSVGASIEGRKFVHVADLNNEGSSIRDLWYPQIKNNGGNMEFAVFYIDRLEDGVEELKKLGLESYSVIPFDANAWQILLDAGKISPKIYKSLNERYENKTVWAYKTLRSHVPTLIELLENPQTRKKGEKILNEGYPELKDELLFTMKHFGHYYNF